MTQILVPIPNTPLGTVQQDKFGKLAIIWSREWYRYLSLLQQAVGGSTDFIIDIAAVTVPNNGGDISAAVSESEVLSLGAPDAGQIEWLLSQMRGLNPQIPGPQELGETEDALTGLTPFGMAPTELGALEAAKNLGYRILASGSVALAAGTATVNSGYANSANEFSLTAKVVAGTQGILSVGTIVANTSFVINSSDVADTSTVSWVIFGAIKG